MGTSRITSLGIAAGLAATGFVWGFCLEILPLSDRSWTFVLLTVMPWALLTTAALRVTLGSRVRFESAMVAGAAAGSVVALALTLGLFSPLALSVGGRHPSDWGGDISWANALVLALMVYAAAGGVIGAVCGAGVWLCASP